MAQTPIRVEVFHGDFMQATMRFGQGVVAQQFTRGQAGCIESASSEFFRQPQTGDEYAFRFDARETMEQRELTAIWIDVTGAD
jgi:hypothetical protein